MAQGDFCVAISQGSAPEKSAMLSNCPMQKCIPKVKLVELSSTKAESNMADIFLKRCNGQNYKLYLKRIEIFTQIFVLAEGFLHEVAP